MESRDQQVKWQGGDRQSGAATEAQAPQEGLWQTIWRRRWMVLLTIVVCVEAGALYLTYATPIHTSTSRLYVEQTGPKIITDSEGVMTQSKNYLHTQAEMLTSTPILAAALKAPEVGGTKSLEGVSNPIAFLKENVEVAVGKKDDLISISFDSPNPMEATRVVKSIVDAYLSYHSQTKRFTAGTVLGILQIEKVKRDAELTAKLREVLEFQKENGAISLENHRGNIAAQSLSALSEAVAKAQVERIEANANYEAAKSLQDDPATMQRLAEAQNPRGSAVSYTIQEARLRDELSQLNLERIALDSNCTADHPAVQTVQAKIDQTEKQLAEGSKQRSEGYLAVTREAAAAAERKEAGIRAAFEQQRVVTEGINLQAARYAVLQSELRRTEKLCDILDTRIKELNITEDAGALNITVLEAARAGSEPTSPSQARVIAVSLAAGLMLGVFLVLVQNHTDQRYRSAAEASASLDVPVLGSVPRVSGRRSTFAQGQCVALEPASPAAEAYRTIRAVAYYSESIRKAKTLLITSPIQGEGKTTLTSNLGIAMAQAGQRTLIIDADFRRPTQQDVFGVPEGPGLAGVLRGETSLDEAIQETAIGRLDVLTAGESPANPSEMLGSVEFTNVLATLSRTYDRILLDSPPVVPVADAAILAAMCDGTLLVLKAGVSIRRTARHAQDNLLHVGANVVGVVVNAVPRGQDSYGYCGHGYSYGKKSSRKSAKADAAKAEPVTADA